MMPREMMVTLFPEAQAFAQRKPDQQAALQVSHLTKHYGSNLVLDDVSFSVAEGESLVILGPSGSGKSTTLRLIAGLDSLDSGEITVHNKRIDSLRARERNVGVIFQNYALFPRMTVAENIGFGLKIRGIRSRQREAVIERLLDLIGLAELRERLPHQISGGQQQRVAIARALAYEPDVLLFDESFSALDPQTRVPLRRDIRALLRKLRVPALFITHDQEEAMELGDHIAILNRGRLEQIGTPAEVYNDPQTEFVATFLGAANVLEGVWRDGQIYLNCERSLLPTGNIPPLLDEEPVKIIFRPEDVLLNTTTGLIDAPYHLGRGEVLDVGFNGASETLTVRLLTQGQSGHLLSPRNEFSRAAFETHRRPHGASGEPENRAMDYVIKVLRTKWDAWRLRLNAGDRVTVGLKTYKALRA
jgi:ABC-type Fe3+/spermidine/putrescine transport system ATPase subunit